MRLASLFTGVEASGSSSKAAMPSAPDSVLLERVQAGEEESIGVLYDAYSAVVYSVALSILCCPKSAEDVLHETFMHLWREPASFKVRGGTLRASLAISAYQRANNTRKQRQTTVADIKVSGTPR